jgi:mono/diheme cytochrome c family protein
MRVAASTCQGRGCLARHTGQEGRHAVCRRSRAQTPFGTFAAAQLDAACRRGSGGGARLTSCAMRHGVRPDGANYYAFPYPPSPGSPTAILRTFGPPTLRPMPARASRTTFVSPLALSHRGVEMAVLHPPIRSDPRRTPAVDRGAYLVEALGHCGECHTPQFSGRRRRTRAGRERPHGQDLPLTPRSSVKWSDPGLGVPLFGTKLDMDSATKRWRKWCATRRASSRRRISRR